MNKIIPASLCLLAAALLTTSTAMAAGKRYVGLNHSSINYDVDGLADDDLKAVVGKFGRQFNPYFASEFRLGTGLGDTTIAGIDLEIDLLRGSFFRAGYPVTPSFYPYAVAGYTSFDFSASAGGLSASTIGSDVSWGAGFDFNVNKRFSINAEYMNYYTRDLIELDTYSIGVAVKF